MKAITLTQPWASLIAIGAKSIETRRWGTTYRGPLAIHAAKGLGSVGGKSGLDSLCWDDPFDSALVAGGYRPGHLDMPQLPLGAVVATCTLVDCIQIYTERQRDAILGRWGGEQEAHFGNFAFNRYAWLLADVMRLPEPIPARGARMLWDWDAPAEVLALVGGR